MKNVVINSNLIGWNAGTTFTAASSASGGTGQTTRCADMTACAAKYSGNINVTKVDWLGKTWMDLRISSPGSMSSGDAQIQMRHLIDGADYAPLIDEEISVHVEVAASEPGQYCIALRNNGMDRSFLYPFVIVESMFPQSIDFTMPPPDPGGSWSTEPLTEGLRVQFTMVAGSNLIGSEGWNNGAMKMATDGQINLALIDNARFRYTNLVIGDNDNLLACEKDREVQIQAERNKFYYIAGSYDKRL